MLSEDCGAGAAVTYWAVWEFVITMTARNCASCSSWNRDASERITKKAGDYPAFILSFRCYSLAVVEH